MSINMKLVLDPNQNLKNFIDMNNQYFEKFLSRGDGNQVSSDFDIQFFDSEDVLSVGDLMSLVNRINREALTVFEVNFLATMLMMSCEDYESEEVEDAIAGLAEINELSELPTNF